MKWIDCIERLPDIDYDNKKTSIKVSIKCLGKEKKCHFRHIISEHGCYGVFYNLKNGKVYRNVTHWMPIPEAPKIIH